MLHIARGATRPSPPTARSLRLEREDAALGLLASVLVGEELVREGARASSGRAARALGDEERAAVVIGAAAYDIRLPSAGTFPPRIPRCRHYAFEERPGGKGLNQAVGLARLGAKVKLISPIGSDTAGAEILEFLRAEGVDTNYVEARRDGKSSRTVALALKNGSYAYIGWKNEHEIRMSNEFLRGAAFQGALIPLRSSCSPWCLSGTPSGWFST